ncbi:MAG: hypothetical protein LBD67_07550 [Candidatus Accumulibacter sp.]|nr:hypothetical protein [Accumulibacter sp.]
MNGRAKSVNNLSNPDLSTSSVRTEIDVAHVLRQNQRGRRLAWLMVWRIQCGWGGNTLTTTGKKQSKYS